MRRSRWLILWFAAATALVIALAVTSFVAWSLRPSRLKARATSALSSRLGLDVTLESLAVSLVPTVRVSGGGLVLRVPGRPDLPPFITVDRFRLEGTFGAAFGGHFKVAHLEGLHITIPPGEDKPDLPESGARAGWTSRVLIDRLETPDAELTILRRKSTHAPLVFPIHALTLTGVGFDRPMPFHAKLTNPVPEGLVESTGHIGPFPKGKPSGLPVSGDYVFSSADLNTIDGIAGTLTSEGHYDGVVSRILVTGRSETPDFSLDLGGKPLPLSATFQAVVDGTDGTTRLDRVDAKLLHTDIQVTGLIDNLPGPGNHSITLNARISKGRLEDLMRLILESPTASISGDIAMQAKVLLPPGHARIRERLRVSGHFDLAAATFHQPQIQAKLAELSRRSQGLDRDEAPTDVVSAVRSGFDLDRGVLSLSDLAFELPGAVVELHGRYDTDGGGLDLTGKLKMQASMSQVVGGWKSMFVKPFNFMFRRDGSGAVIPIAVSGTRESPQLRIRMGALLKRGG